MWKALKERLSIIVTVGAIIGGYIVFEDRFICTKELEARMDKQETEIVATMKAFRDEINQEVRANKRDRLIDKRRDYVNEASDLRWKLRSRPGDRGLSDRLNSVNKRISDIDRKLEGL